MNFIELTDQELEDLIYCIESHIITLEQYNQGDEYDVATTPFENLRKDILQQVNKNDGN